MVKPPIMIRIPEIQEIMIDANNIVYLSGYPIGLITPLCPDGFMEIHTPTVNITGGKQGMVVANIESEPSRTDKVV